MFILAPTLVELAHSEKGKTVLKVTNERDFVFGGMLTLVMLDVVLNRESALTEDELIEVFAVTLKRFKEIDSMVASARPKKKGRSKKVPMRK